MDIRYSPNMGLVLAIGIGESDVLIRMLEIAIETFKNDYDVECLEQTLEMAKEDLIHTVQ